MVADEFKAVMCLVIHCIYDLLEPDVVHNITLFLKESFNFNNSGISCSE